MKKVPKAPRRSHAFGTSEPKRNVASHDYDEKTETLTVTFASGKRYSYAGVPKDVAAGFSGGSYLRSAIIGKYPHTLLGD